MIDQLVYDMETDILARIAYYLSRGAVASADWQTRKLAQLGALTKDAQSIINQYRARILLQTGKAVTESAEYILTQIRARTPKQLKTIAAMTPEMRAIIETWSGSAATKVNLAMAQLAQNAGGKYVAAVSKASLSVVTGTETLQRSVFQAIGELERLDAFVSYDKLGNKRTWTPEGYVKMVVRDNQRRASTATMFQAAAEGDTDLIEVSSHLGARPKCAPYQGRIFSISGRSKKYPALADTSFGQVDGLLGINCVLEGTLVSGPAERAVYRRKYSGEIITIRTSTGHELSVTPNHPILTNKGWVNAYLLAVGDNVISRAGLDRVGLCCPDPNNGIATVEQKFNTLINSGDVFRLPVSSCNFHGDVPDHEVDVVFEKGFLRNSMNATRRKHIEQDALHRTTKSSNMFKGVRALYKAFIRSFQSFYSFVCGIRNSIAPLFPSAFMHLRCCNRSVIGDRDSKIREIFSDRSLANTNLFGDFIFPEAGVIHGEKVVGGKTSLAEQVVLPVSSAHIDAFTIETIQDCLDGAIIVSCDGSNGNTGEIQIDRIVDIKRETPQSSFVHVYNLQTETGWYFSNGIISHNCGHVIYPYFEGLSTKTYEPYQSKKNKEAYAQSQEQRAAERKIRYYKREAQKWGATEGGEQKAAYFNTRVKESQAEMREFIKETGRTRQRDREAIYG